MNLTVKTTGAQQGRVEYVGTVSSRQDDDTGVGTETVHLRQELVQRTLPFVITTGHHTLTAASTDRIDLINEDDRRRFLFRLTEEIPHTAGSYAHKHLHEIATRHREERYVRFTCNGFGEQGLTRSRRAYQECAFRNFRTDLGVFLGVLQKLHDLLYLLFGTVQTCYIFEGHFVLFVRIEQLRLRFTDTEDTARSTCATDSATHIHEEQDQQRKRQDIDQNQVPVVT